MMVGNAPALKVPCTTHVLRLLRKIRPEAYALVIVGASCKALATIGCETLDTDEKCGGETPNLALNLDLLPPLLCHLARRTLEILDFLGHIFVANPLVKRLAA